MESVRETIGGFKVVKLLGKGGMSEVYEVENPASGSRHALKLFAYPKENEEVLLRFKTEGRLLAKLGHPRIVKVTDMGTDGESGKPYFVMDLVLDPNGEVKTLGDVPDGEADEEMVGRWYDDIREGLEYIHAHGVVHRDLKLQNIMVGPDGHAVITDFGISRIFDPGGNDATVVDPVQTILRLRDGKNLVMGSIGYMAPEIEMGMPATPKSDWYALGVITYKLLTGMWCDAKTDVGETLDTYDPVWKRIIPKLLHSNPAGRECLSYAAEKALDQEAREVQLEERYLKEKRRGHLARHVARYVTAALLALAAVFAFSVYEFRSQRELWRLKLENAGVLCTRVPSFDELFKIPQEAKGEAVEDDEGKVLMPSIPQFEAARVDALVLTHGTMAAFESGKKSAEEVVDDFERLYELLDENSVVSPFDNLQTGDATYSQVSDTNDPLRILLRLAIDRLKASSKK